MERDWKLTTKYDEPPDPVGVWSPYSTDDLGQQGHTTKPRHGGNRASRSLAALIVVRRAGASSAAQVAPRHSRFCRPILASAPLVFLLASLAAARKQRRMASSHLWSLTRGRGPCVTRTQSKLYQPRQSCCPHSRRSLLFARLQTRASAAQSTGPRHAPTDRRT